ncbi:ATP synthase subunit I [Thermosulfuriphilus sp.]
MIFRLEMNERFIRRLHLANWGLTISFSLAGLLLSYPREIVLGLFLGGVISNLNFHSLHRDIRHFVLKLRAQRPNSYYLKYGLRLIATAFILYVLISRKIAHPLALLLGLSVVVINILTVALSEATRGLVLKAKEG